MVMNTLFKRLQETGKNWRCVYKALLVLDYLIKNGSENCIREAQARSYELKSLTRFSYLDEDGKDQGLNGVPHVHLLFLHSTWTKTQKTFTTT